jgi:hypothetical protein
MIRLLEFAYVYKVTVEQVCKCTSKPTWLNFLCTKTNPEHSTNGQWKMQQENISIAQTISKKNLIQLHYLTQNPPIVGISNILLETNRTTYLPLPNKEPQPERLRAKCNLAPLLDCVISAKSSFHSGFYLQ